MSPVKGLCPSPGTLGELLNRPPRPEGRRGYGAQIFDFSAPSRAKALPHYSPSLVGLTPSLLLSPSVTASRRPRLRGWRFEDGPKGPAEPEPQPGEAEVGARKKMIEEAATWAAPTARRQNLRFCRPRSAKPTWKPFGLPTLNRQSRFCGFRRPRFARLEVRKQRLRTETPARRRPRPGRRYEGAAAPSYIPKRKI